MAANITYHEQTDMDNIRKLREVLKTLPAFAKDYFRAIEPTTSTKTRISYAYDIRIFFQFLISQNPSLAKIGIPNLNVSVLDQLKPIDIEEYMEYLKLYDSPNDQTTITNGERGLKRKISSLRSFYTYYYKRQAIETNPVQLVDMPKIHDKAIIRLDAGETAALLDYIEHCGYHKSSWCMLNVDDHTFTCFDAVCIFKTSRHRYSRFYNVTKIHIRLNFSYFNMISNLYQIWTFHLEFFLSHS